MTLDGGPLDVNTVIDPVSGRPLLRQQLLLGSCGPTAVVAAAGSSAVAAELSMGLQRILLLAQAVAELQQQQVAAVKGHPVTGGSSNTAAAVQTLVQVSYMTCARYTACRTVYSASWSATIGRMHLGTGC